MLFCGIAVLMGRNRAENLAIAYCQLNIFLIVHWDCMFRPCIDFWNNGGSPLCGNFVQYSGCIWIFNLCGVEVVFRVESRKETNKYTRKIFKWGVLIWPIVSSCSLLHVCSPRWPGGRQASPHETRMKNILCDRFKNPVPMAGSYGDTGCRSVKPLGTKFKKSLRKIGPNLRKSSLTVASWNPKLL